VHSGPSEDTTFSSCSVVMCTVVVLDTSGDRGVQTTITSRATVQAALY